ncbi:PAN domain-containing protein [Forsythia ovata]|uniref:PAN domain-containing protein n=1 Tax=Forsythia ovata TaxID=205694 RepID=A0ABD1PLM3_9LAMI
MDTLGLHFNSLSRIPLLTILSVLCINTWWSRADASTIPQERLRGFKATPNSSNSSFQPLISNSTALLQWQSCIIRSSRGGTLVNSDGRRPCWLGSDFIGLYTKFNPNTNPSQIYLKHKPLEAKAAVVKGQGPIRVVLTSDGYLGMFQMGSTPVDVQSFNSFQQNVFGIRRVRIEPDGNLKGYSTVLGIFLFSRNTRNG